jgi:hypothetical protein
MKIVVEMIAVEMMMDLSILDQMALLIETVGITNVDILL